MHIRYQQNQHQLPASLFNMKLIHHRQKVLKMDSNLHIRNMLLVSQFSRFLQSAANPAFLVHKCYDDDQELSVLDIEGLHISGGNS